jgi:hypothetical protein
MINIYIVDSVIQSDELRRKKPMRMKRIMLSVEKPVEKLQSSDCDASQDQLQIIHAIITEADNVLSDILSQKLLRNKV